MRIRFARHGIGQSGYAARVRRRPPPREAGDGQIEAAPEEVYGARLAEKAAAEALENTIGLDEDAPESVCGLAIVSSMDAILGEGDRVRHLVRPFRDTDGNAEIVQQAEQAVMEVGDGLRLEPERPLRPGARANEEPLRDEIKLDLEDSAGTCQL